MKNHRLLKLIKILILTFLITMILSPVVNSKNREYVQQVQSGKKLNSIQMNRDFLNNKTQTTPTDYVWEKIFTGFIARRVEIASDGGYVFIDYQSGSNDIFMKVNDAGDKQWSQPLGEDGDYYCGNFIKCSDGGYAGIGRTNSIGEGGSDIWLIKTDFEGNKLWDQTYGGAENDYGSSVMQTTDGGYLICGSTSSFETGEFDFWLIKTDDMGYMKWNQTIDGGTDEECIDFFQTSDGGYIFAGMSISFNNDTDRWEHHDLFLIKIDSENNVIWKKTLFNPDCELGVFNMLLADDGGYILSASIFSSGEVNDYGMLIKTDNDGNKLWEREYAGNEDVHLLYVSKTSDGGYVLTGNDRSYSDNLYDTFLIKTDEEGNEEWAQIFQNSKDLEEFNDKYIGSSGYCVKQVLNGGYIISGTINHGDSYESDWDCWLIKTDEKGESESTVQSQNQYSTETESSDPLEVRMPKIHMFNLVEWFITKIKETLPLLESLLHHFV